MAQSMARLGNVTGSVECASAVYEALYRNGAHGEAAHE